MTVLEVLKGARALIAQGWTQGNMRRWRRGKDGGYYAYCAVGALEEAGRGHSLRYREAGRALGETIGSNAIIAWNDKRGRTQQQVLSAFDKTIGRLRLEQVQVEEDEEVMLAEVNRRARKPETLTTK